MREFLRKKDMRKYLYLETTKAGAKTPALSIRHIGIYRTALVFETPTHTHDFGHIGISLIARCF